MAATIYTTKDGDMVDEICWRHYGNSKGYTEAVLEANYRLEDQPLQLPAGLRITLPEVSVTTENAAVVRLWD